MIIRYPILAVLIGLSAFLKAQFQIKNHYSFAGKKDVSVNCVIQDLNGFICLGTNEGVFRFDGKTALRALKDQSVLKQNITALYMDAEEVLWIGTKSGKVYSVAKNKLDSLTLPQEEENKRITSFYELNHVLWIGTYGNGLYKYSNGQVNSYKTEAGLSDNVIYKIAGDGKNRVWFATDAGISELIKHNATSDFKIISDKNGLPDNIVRDISFVDEKLLISMQDSGVCYYNLSKQQIEKIHFFSDWTHGTVLNTYTKDHGKTMTVATERNGLIHIKNGVVALYRYQDLLQQEFVNQVISDKAGGIWIASKKGISQLEEKRFDLINKLQGLENEKVLALAADKNNTLWFGTTSGISKMLGGAEGNLVFQNVQDISKYTISCATEAPDGTIWFGTYGNGIIILNSENKNEVVINSGNSALPNDNISHIFFSNQHTVYISTLGGGLVKGHLEAGNKFTIETVYTETSGFGSNYVYASVTDKNGTLYAATDGGGLQLLEKEKFTDLTKKFGFNSNTVFSICADRLNNIWAISNDDGLLKYDGKKLINLTQNNGLRELQPQQMIPNDDLLFVLNSKGLDKINIKDNSISYYDYSESELDPNLNAILVHGNTLYSGTNNGILTYRVENKKQDSVKPIVYIKGLNLNYKPFPLDSMYEFNYNQNNIAITFDGIWLRNPDKLHFRYRLNGLEEEWQYAEEGKTVNYNNLDPGDYTFLVQAKNEEDIWSDPTGYAFIIKTPIWKRWWFWLLIITGSGFGIYYVFKYRLRTLQKENLVLEKRVAERTFQIEKQARIIEEKNKDITDSIFYAKKIQHAILPREAQIKKHLPNSFVLYITKDIVSGDFYWFTSFNNFSIIAAVDCTGHGVPGAFMSLIGSNILNRIINELKISDPKEILLHLNKGVLAVLRKDESESKDGMDIALCKINHDKNTLEYAGAMRPLWIVDNNEIIEIKADKIPVGTKPSDREEPIVYTTHEIELNKNKTFYIFTDGYADQFGGDRDKKFSTGRFKELIMANAHLDFAIQEKNIRQAHLDWKGEHEQVDDILLIGFKV